MSKRLFSFIITAIMVLSMAVVSVQAAVPAVFAGPATHSADPNTANGSITTSVTVYNTADTAAKATLIVATYNGNTLSKVDFDSKSIQANHGIDLSATINKESGETLRYFVWDDFSTLCPIKTETGVYSLNLSEGTQVDNATSGKPTSITAADEILRTSLGHSTFTYVEGGLTGKTLSANSWSVETFDNKKCFSIYASSSATYGMQCMDYSDTIFAENVKYEDVTIYVKYFDNSEGLFTILVSSHNGTKSTNTTKINVWGTGSNTWKTAVYKPTVMGGKKTSNAEFWITPNVNWSEAPLYISEVGVCVPTPEASIDTEAPAAPTGLAAANITPSTVDISWTASDAEDLAYYNVYRNGEVIAQSTEITYTSTGLTDGTTYVYTVTAVNTSEIESELSEPVSATTSTIYRMDMSGVTDDGTTGTRPKKTADNGMLKMLGVKTNDFTIVTDEPNAANEVAFINYADSTPCFASYKLTNNYGLRFDFGADFLSATDTTTVNSVTFVVKYLDNFATNQYIQIGYVQPGTSSSPKMQTTAIKGGNTGEWKEAQVTYTDVRSDKSPDFCIRPYGIEGVVYISEIGVAKNN